MVDGATDNEPQVGHGTVAPSSLTRVQEMCPSEQQWFRIVGETQTVPTSASPGVAWCVTLPQFDFAMGHPACASATQCDELRRPATR